MPLFLLKLKSGAKFIPKTVKPAFNLAPQRVAVEALTENAEGCGRETGEGSGKAVKGNGGAVKENGKTGEGNGETGARTGGTEEDRCSSQKIVPLRLPMFLFSTGNVDEVKKAISTLRSVVSR